MAISSVKDYRELARRRLPKQLFDFIVGGAYEEFTIEENNAALGRILFNKRVLRDVSTVSTQTTILGQPVEQPLILAPVGFAGIYARRGEILAARAAQRAGVPFSLSTLSICSLEEVKQSTCLPFWFQLYMIKDRGYCKELLQKAHECGCPVLFLTVDLPVVGVRYRDIRNGMAPSVAPVPGTTRLRRLWELLSHPRWFYDVYLKGQPFLLGNLQNAIPDIRDLTKMRIWVDNHLEAGLTWKDVEWVRKVWPGKMVLKGILDVEDARQAQNFGADGIVVSNHAGRHFDSTPATISVLPGIVEACSLEVLIDGGFFSGLDLVKALALGAKGVMIGRPWALALAARGEQGVSEILQIYQQELMNAMAHLGVTSIAQIDKSLIKML